MKMMKSIDTQLLGIIHRAMNNEPHLFFHNMSVVEENYILEFENEEDNQHINVLIGLDGDANVKVVARDTTYNLYRNLNSFLVYLDKLELKVSQEAQKKERKEQLKKEMDRNLYEYRMLENEYNSL